MKQVAREAGVSVATVSHVLNDTRYVSPELMERVRSAADRLGYTPNRSARNLRTRRTQMVGLIVPDVNPFFAELTRVVENHGFAAGYTTVLGNSDGHPDRERAYVEMLVSHQVDGLILASTADGDRSLASIVEASRTPVVVLDRDVDLPGVDTVLADNVGGGHAATAHLIELGHTRIGCITGGSERLPSAGRVEGYRRALAEAGIELDRRRCADGDFQYAGGRAAIARLLDADPGLTAVFATNDLMAIGALGELADRGIRVPEEFSVCGFDDAFPAELLTPSLTTVRQPLEELGRAAVDTLIARIEGTAGDEPVRSLHRTHLVVRESTAPPPRLATPSSPKGGFDDT